MKRRVAGCLLCLAVLPQAYAAERLIFAGAEKRRHGEHYAYLGALLPLPGANRLGDGWVQRYWVDTYRYAYDVSNPALYPVDPQTIRARARGVEAAVGYQFERGRWQVAGYAGLRHTETRFAPDDPGSRVRGSRLWPKFQFEIGTDLASRWRTDNIVAYTAGLDGYWLRSRLTRATASGYEIGPELVILGDRDFKALKAGVVVGGLRPTPDSRLALRLGYHLQSTSSSPYAGIDLSVAF